MKKTTSALFIIPLLLTLLSSCSDLDSSTYSGRVLSFGTFEPVEGATVNVIAGKSTGFLEPQIKWLIDSVKTDSEGKFKITVDDGDYHEIGSIRKEGYFSDLSPYQIDGEWQGQDETLFDQGPLQNKDYVINPIGTLHVIIENDPTVAGDFIRGSIPGHIGALLTSQSIEEFNLVRANRYSKYSYIIDQDELVKDSLFITPFDTTQLKIIF